MLAVLIAYLVLAVGYSIATPVFEAPDEVLHVAYVRFLTLQRRLPVLQPGELSEYHQAPLYYVIGAALTGWVRSDDFEFAAAQRNPFWAYRDWEIGRDNKNQFLHGPWEAWPWRGTALLVHLLRLYSVLLGVGALVVTYRISLDLFGSPVTALGPLAFMAFNPMFLFISGSVTNDPLTMLVGALILWTALRLLRHGLTLRLAVQLGILLGVGWMTKITTLFLLPAVGLAILLSPPRSTLSRWRASLIAFGLALALGGWVFARNILVYGDPTSLRQDLVVWGQRSLEDSLAVFDQDLRFIWTSTWGGFATGQAPLPPAFSAAMGVVAALALIGLLRIALSRSETRKRELAVLVIAVLGLSAALIYYTLISSAGRYGRYTFAALAAFVALLFWGLSALAPRRWVAAVAAGSNAGMAAAATMALLVYLAPVYGPPPRLDQAQLASLAQGPHYVGAILGGVARLAAAQVEPGSVNPGGQVLVSLTWESIAPTSQNYVLFVHLIDDAGVIIAQRDTYTGLGQFPTSFWQPGDAFTDQITVPIPETAYRPNLAQVQVGLYDYNGGGRLPVQQIGNSGMATDSVVVGQVSIAATPEAWPNAVSVNFDNQIALVGYTVTPRAAVPGQALDLTLYWQAIGPVRRNYTVFAHVLGQGESVWAIGDGRPEPPPTMWAPGQVVEDHHRLELPAEIPPGQYQVEIGLYRASTGERLKLIAADGRRTLEDRLLLSPIRIRER